MLNTPVQTKKDVLAIIRQNQNKVRSFGVKRLGVFGSFVRNEQDDESDIDLLVEFEAGQKTFNNFIHLSFWLEDTLRRPVELVTVESISPYLRPTITQEVEYVMLSPATKGCGQHEHDTSPT